MDHIPDDQKILMVKGVVIIHQFKEVLKSYNIEQ